MCSPAIELLEAEATRAVWHVITWHLNNGRALQLQKSIPHLYWNDCGVDLQGTPSTSLLSRQFGLMSVSRYLIPSSMQFFCCPFYCIAYSLVHDCFQLSDRCMRLFESIMLFWHYVLTGITATAALTRICSSVVLWHTHTQSTILKKARDQANDGSSKSSLVPRPHPLRWVGSGDICWSFGPYAIFPFWPIRRLDSGIPWFDRLHRGKWPTK